MTYKATISSKGQVTIPIEARRKLGLKKHITFEIKNDELTIKRQPTLEDLRAILETPSKPGVLSERDEAMADMFVESDRRSRDT